MQRGFAARSVFLEGHDVRHLRKVPRSQGERVLQEIFVVVVEFAAPPARTSRSKRVRSRMPRRTRVTGEAGVTAVAGIFS